MCNAVTGANGKNPVGSTTLDHYDYNHDGVVNHDDVAFFIAHMKSGQSMAELLAFQKAGGKLDAQDLLDVKAHGGSVTSSDVADFVEQGGKLTQADVDALQSAGVLITPEDLARIENKLGVTFGTGLVQQPDGTWAPAPKTQPAEGTTPTGETTPAKLIEAAKHGKKVTALDLLALKKADGTPMATGADFVKLKEAGVDVEPEDMIAFQMEGGVLKGKDLTKLVDLGMPITQEKLIVLVNPTTGKTATNITVDELANITKKAGLTLTQKQFYLINPTDASGKHMFNFGPEAALKKGSLFTPSELLAMAKCGVHITGKNLANLVGEDGKPLAKAGDFIKLMKEGGTVTSADLAAAAEKGVKFSAQDLIALGHAGVRYDRADLMHILEKTGTIPTNAQANALAPYLVG